MQHTPVTIEDQLISKAVREECQWENLPKRLQSILGSKDEWHRRVTAHCIKKRLLWNTCFACKVCKEGEYYEDMMRYLRKNLALFPYHLAEYVCRVMRISPFRYYCDMIFEVMRNEQPYDSIPNFSAADAFRLTGIGRNEFIDIMNKCRSKKIMWKLNKSIAKDFLPTLPVDFPIDPWWGVCLVNFTIEEFKKLSEDEMATIDKICKEEANAYFLFDPEVIKGLYQRGLVYFDVPVYQDDRFKVSKLEGFISNREQSYEDPIEELLYAVFVVSNENSTVAELASTLQADVTQLQAAASFVCRLGWAVKLIDPSSVLHDKIGSPRAILSDDEDASRASISSTYRSADGEEAQHGDNLGTESSGSRSSHVRVAFIVDANITSYLMMGSVSPGLKSHAVTLYEAGKLGHTSIPDLCQDLSTLEGAKFEGELQEFANHAFSLRCVLECLISGGVATDAIVDTMGSGTLSNDEAVTLLADVNLPDNSGDSLTSQIIEASMVSDAPQEVPLSTEHVPESTKHEAASSTPSVDTTALTETFSSNLNLQNEGKPIPVEGPDTGKGNKKRKKYRVDILRCESLASLTPATLDRLFSRDYDIVVSMIPLPLTTVLPGPSGPVHFGPPSHSSMTQWMKLVLYSTVGIGPLSVILMKGQCLRMLPAPLAGCEKAIIWSWDGSSVGGLGNKFEGNLVKGGILLHCLNCLLKCSAVLVQPLSKHDLDSSGRIVTLDIPLPLKNSDGSIPHFGDELGLPLEENTKLNSLLTKLANNMELKTVGYIRLLKLFKAKDSLKHFSPDNDEKYEWVPLTVEFGFPLFSPKLCNNICKRIVSSQLLQADSLMEQHDAMQCIRKRLKDICALYQATGPAAKLLYQKEQAKEPTRTNKLMNYASGRWNPLVDPSSPISGATSEFQRLKLANRQRCRTEVLSFDGSILRSYTLAPVYEAATRSIDENAPLSTTKSDSDEADSREVILPGLNLLYDGSELHPFDIGACLQARQPVALIAEAAAASASLAPK
ncbi:FAM91 carboxy-terminus protein [Arabidopsis thaliana]|uniref:FAM91 carboxy-terminus protein n=2 Tax=Arabidopsis thaliana TaxID=3702 RepID=F4HYA7_ARATH|nr:FAM91 carboxy-terminus protein [Arabidopsis thaliana]NP_001321752.1 FAM91 carboxy-terminus protein [Arabidopsis thaliana]NP_174756.2 FAM91 carboxy-terminus protein [Arabidopsis thaliana]AEE31769.1 FAM91 carboxy-terminus protein [Arabidopsis thaliana]ANM59388.1 FAM91 carboxy-terminus protein [Arabidopsis thaliana]ANM59389.1 FAM91 carboxy-terminus protein [Arabidopsis thaliana]|eukprot:NP_001321751.1 FAM91 carboxy-terminus protein [Arabidopsis thaliana]